MVKVVLSRSCSVLSKQKMDGERIENWTEYSFECIYIDNDVDSNSQSVYRIVNAAYIVCVCIVWFGQFCMYAIYGESESHAIMKEKVVLYARARATRLLWQIYTHMNEPHKIWSEKKTKTVNRKVTGNIHIERRNKTEGETHRTSNKLCKPRQCDLMVVILFSNDLSFDEYNQ